MRLLRSSILALLALLAFAAIDAALQPSSGASADPGDKMYWTVQGPGAMQRKIVRANLDGSDIEDVVAEIDPYSSPFNIALDVPSGKIYWADVGTRKIQRANLDGSNVEDLVTGHNFYDIALHPSAGMMYWTEADAIGTGAVRRANLDGSGVETLATNDITGALGIALDVGGGKVYWWHGLQIRRAALNGSGAEGLVSTGGADGIALDADAGKMYWTGTDPVLGGVLRRANLDGSGVENLVTGLGLVNGIALDVAGGKMYWVDLTGKIQRANLDGSGVEDLVTTGLDLPFGMALDLTSPPVGGIVELRTGADAPADASGSSADRDYAASIGAAIAVAAIALVAGGWYARRRFRQRRI